MLLPGYLSQIQGSTPEEQAKILEKLFNTAKSTPLKDKVLSKMLGSMAVALTLQAKHLHRQAGSALRKWAQSLLCQALDKEFSDPLALAGLFTAMSIKQERHESPQE